MKTLVVFSGTDFLSHIVLKELMQFCYEKGIQLLICFTIDKTNEKIHAEAISEYLYYERRFLFEDRVLDLKQIAGKTGTIIKFQVDANSKDFLCFLSTLNLLSVINLRGYQKFRSNIIADLEAKNVFFVNLHPGLLPEYKGIFSTFWSMYNEAKKFGCTLHKVNEEYDSGEIILSESLELNYSISVFENVLNLAPTVKGMLFSFLSQITNKQSLKVSCQQIELSRYYSFPSKQNIDTFMKKQKLIDLEQASQLVKSNLTSASS
jgi:hypothetical protein|tara:strand:- start:99 stop:887 length:789 start_codon:yes stop_codon:yes gene_type:complete